MHFRLKFEGTVSKPQPSSFVPTGCNVVTDRLLQLASGTLKYIQQKCNERILLFSQAFRLVILTLSAARRNQIQRLKFFDA